ncbi:MAG: GNAT family N-acetyltransferase [Gammaproteobacteria bacterium]|nr:GNAT family N-acetyltransferase [Gammaproteobacteria bacterium]MDH5801526.1 GNAT family N-acetyltransferase [Gammaproteobacteria bacterium]
MEYQTTRLKLRQWREDDLPLFAKMNADPVVMEFYPRTLTVDESNAMARKIMGLIQTKGWGFWAVERLEDQQFLGFTGLHEPDYNLPVSPCVEVGWRLDMEYWGFGYATEAARVALRVAFEELHISQVYSFASVGNFKSRAVMERIGMEDTRFNFEHPLIPPDHSLREHVLYLIKKDTWLMLNERS